MALPNLGISLSGKKHEKVKQCGCVKVDHVYQSLEKSKGRVKEFENIDSSIMKCDNHKKNQTPV